MQVRGIPIRYVGEDTVRYIAQTLGDVVSMDFHSESSSQVNFIRVKIIIGVTDRLRFSEGFVLKLVKEQ